MNGARALTTTVIFVLLSGCASVPAPVDSALNAQLRNAVRQELNPSRTTAGYMRDGEPLRSSNHLLAFYRQHNYQPLWFRNLSPLKQVEIFEHTIAQIESHGLRPDYFHYSVIEETLKRLDHRSNETTESTVDLAARLDVLLTDAYMAYVSHMTGIGLSDEIQQAYWQRNPHSENEYFTLLDQGLHNRHFERFLTDLPPQDDNYRQLQNGLQRYRTIALAGGWPTVPPGQRLELGVQDPRVALLRERLAKSGDLAANNGQTRFDGELDRAVHRFQQRHGLESDGIVMRQTLAALNVPAASRVRQIAVNLERRRWLPQTKPSRLVRVNVPAYQLELFEKNNKQVTMKVIVGQKKDDWQTPQINSAISHMILNPLWNVPPGIFAKEMLQDIKDDPDYLQKQNMIVVRIRNGQGEVDPKTIDWNQVDPDNPDIRIIQKSGDHNALGKIKFIFPNPHAIYLHDTTAKYLFSRSNRTFSHGCIRVEKAMELAKYLLAETPEWPDKRFQASLATESNYRVTLDHPVDLQIVYWTAWPGDNGEIQFRPDIYGYDEQLAAALDLLAPSAGSL